MKITKIDICNLRIVLFILQLILSCCLGRKRIIDTSLFSNRHKAIKRLQNLSPHKNDQTKTSVVGITNYSRYTVFSLNRGLHQCFLKNLSCTHTHTQLWTLTMFTSLSTEVMHLIFFWSAETLGTRFDLRDSNYS